MKPLPPTPYTRMLLTGECQVIWHHLEKKGNYSTQHYTCTSEVEAGIMQMHKTALWILQPLASWLRCQEHVCSVMQISNAGRAKEIGKLHAMVTRMMAASNTMPHHVANWLLESGLAIFDNAMPGKSSKYFEGALQLRIYLREYAAHYATTEKTPQ